jgi:virulence-associated protein VagC
MTQTAELMNTDQGQLVRLPEEFRLPGPRVSIRKEGSSVVLEPLKETSWPPGFFEAIQIDDSAFQRPDQGALPPVVALD